MDAMIDDLDQSLRRLSHVTDDPRLDALAPTVFARMRADGAARAAGVRLAGVAAIGAVTMGLIAADPIPRPQPAATFADDLALAPSTLLAGR
ncbi:hypothetical protein ASE90_00070 [Sphingomonas sp. Leaf67]|nr:hypothetical protein ASE91_13710 [Sphingomonas sp. Leaf62]KQN91281.1 hypothetical protein ASE90_00070 [Sphingomonas sp. Leaf67]